MSPAGNRLTETYDLALSRGAEGPARAIGSGEHELHFAGVNDIETTGLVTLSEERSARRQALHPFHTGQLIIHHERQPTRKSIAPM